ncbi:phage portal protein [Ralstonia syzygii subsp. celebesensis]|uniref:Phage portal protein n=3 Tax=Ralstonia solanacearum species complex TaxID=3116862 RepID=A0A1U9VGB7_9RALS|nr:MULTISPECIES: phage portal protein [Ralstonia solanacearum species complex]CCA79916.1 putative phage phi-105 orf25-like portal protein [blood disease bacterium R229]AQW29535.1 phage portal protein [blood disease bacterium A2-HR MARDI]AST27262.1 phage portal protein [Ralstonia pseudosolanacearum]MDC6284646.1 phage portal protein [Ralstonia pseudosolanacearum]QQV56592.1 phage portal protein [Ralstonia syzygii subsp. celebesensis]
MIFDRLFESRSSIENPEVPLTGRNLQEWLHGDGAATVTEQTAMRLTAVYSCINVLSTALAQLPAVVLRRQGDNIKPATDHPAYYLLHDEPNAWQTSYKWRETKQAHVCGWGNGYSVIRRNRAGEVVELQRSLPWQTALVRIGNRWAYSTLDEDDYPLAVAPEDMIHIRALGSDGRMGISPIRQHAETIGLGLSVQRYGKEFFDGGGRPTGLLTVKGDLQDKSWERLKSFWAKAVARLKQSDNKTLLLPADLDYKSISIAPEDAQYLETRKFNRSEIASLYNVPGHMINDLERATFSNISEQGVGFVRYTMMPWVMNWEQEINRKVFTPAERRAGYYVKLNLAALLRGTPKERAEFYHYGITDGWLDRNEVRALEDLNPREGLSELLISVNAKSASEAAPPPASVTQP